MVSGLVGSVGGGGVEGLFGSAAGFAGASAGLVGGGVGFAGAAGGAFGAGGVSEIDTSSISKMRSDFAGMWGGRPASP